jgi:homoaconitase/3-isopropylmalate dehydratase large subunit
MFVGSCTAGRWRDNANLKIMARVRQPETFHEVWNSALSAWPAWLARKPKNSREEALKTPR